MGSSSSAWTCATALLLTLCSCEGDRSPTAGRGQAITDGVEHSGHPAVGQLRRGSARCTATLVGSRTVITAAHCVLPGSEHTFTTDDGRIYHSLEVHRHPQFDPNPNVLSENDVALIVLDGAPPIAPAAISTSAPAVGMDLTLIGFGATRATGGGPMGIKRLATNEVDEVSSTRFKFSGTGDGEGLTCDGDSGGPAFTMDGGSEVILGVTSSAKAGCAEFTWDARVDIHRRWLDDHMDRLSSDPLVSITAPQEGAQVPDTVSVSIEVTHDQSITAVECWVGTSLQQIVAEAPYTCEVQLAPGEQTIRVVARDALDQRGETQITVTSGAGADAGTADGGPGADDAAGGSSDGGLERPKDGCNVAGTPTPGAMAWVLAWALCLICCRKAALR